VDGGNRGVEMRLRPRTWKSVKLEKTKKSEGIVRYTLMDGLSEDLEKKWGIQGKWKIIIRGTLEGSLGKKEIVWGVGCRHSSPKTVGSND
jgi:hypothetical protein